MEGAAKKLSAPQARNPQFQRGHLAESEPRREHRARSRESQGSRIRGDEMKQTRVDEMELSNGI